MIIEALLALMHSEEGTPYIYGGHGPRGTDCSGLVSQLANIVSDRDPFMSRFDTSNEEGQLASRGFIEGTAPNALVVGWNRYHTAATLPDGTPVSSGEGGGVHFGGGGAYEGQFTHHMYLPVDLPAPLPEPIPAPDIPLPPPPPPPESADFAPPPPPGP